jgi:hypothetical protein
MSRTASAAYLEKLRSPLWQKKRLQVFERDKWTCRTCSATDKTLHVHHVFYRPGCEPWDYPIWAFLTLCADCHEQAHEAQRAGIQYLIEAFARRQIPDGFMLDLAVALDLDGERELSNEDARELLFFLKRALGLFERGIPFGELSGMLPGLPKVEALPDA